MDAAQPSFEIGKHEVDDGQESFGDLHITPFRDSGVEIVALGKSGVATIACRGYWYACAVETSTDTCHDDRIVDAAPLAARTTTHVSFISLDNFFGITDDLILIWSNHADAQLVKNLKSSLVARQSELPLELNRRYAGCCVP